MDAFEGSDEFSGPQDLQLRHAQPDPLKVLRIGADVEHFANHDPGGRHLVQQALDTTYECAIALLEADLSSERARDLQIRGLASKKLVDDILLALEDGNNAAQDIAQSENEG